MTAKATSSQRARKTMQTLDAKLDEALVGTFPASDPVAVGSTTATEAPSRPVDRKAPLIDTDHVAAVRRQRKAG